MRRVQDLLDGQFDARLFTDAVGAAARLGARMVGDDRRPAGGVGVELQFAEAVTSGLSDPPDFLLGCRGRQAPGVDAGPVALSPVAAPGR